jgi:hypothetical protein
MTSAKFIPPASARINSFPENGGNLPCFNHFWATESTDDKGFHAQQCSSSVRRPGYETVPGSLADPW